ncbi:DUF2599 domain-containing protein [Cellulosimicrobium sp. PMB13]|uniref:DUF2599 domain-containing protein n=1 Tax=Cellulosimicrobium sp. PMB13 TaxID=3120158 RepID=UPI003F4BFF18
MTRWSGSVRRAAVLLAAILTVGATSACTAGAPSDPTSATTQAGTSAPDVDADVDVDATTPQERPSSSVDTARATSGDVVVDVEVPLTTEPPGPGADDGAGAVRVGTDDDGATTLTLTVGPEPAVLVLATPGTFAANADGTVTVLDAAGTPVGGLARPTATPAEPAPGTGDGLDDPGTTPRARLVVTDPTRVEVTVDAVDATSSGTTGREATGGLANTPAVTVTTTLGTDALRTTSWGEREGGRSLAVDPTGWARAGGTAAQDVLWAALVAAEPEADTPGMHDQLVCHALGAPDKATWNLEPWRPDVGLVAVVAARCNPS